MKVYFRQTGGFAGIDQETTVDSSSLPPDEANRIEDIVNNSKFFTLPSKTAPPTRGADYFVYIVTVETAEGQYTVETTDLTMPTELRPLVKFLRAKLKNK